MSKAVLVIALALVDGCGGTGAACPPPADAGPIADADLPDPRCSGTGCGGDLTGTWRFVASCGAGGGSLGQCAESQLTYLRYHLDGTLAIDSHGIATLVGTEDAAADLFAPLDCFNFTECGQFEPLFMVAFKGSVISCSGHFEAGECAETTTPASCDCRGVINGPTTLQATFATSGTNLTVTVGSEVIPGEYCVQNDELWIHATRFGSADIRWRLERVQ